MSFFNIKSKLNNIEGALYKSLNFVFSGFIGFILAKTGIIGCYSPFTISILSVSPATDFSVIFLYIGMIIGYITNGFSALNFKYICANSIIFIFILMFGKKTYINKIYTAVLPGAVCFSIGTIFLFADGFTVYDFMLVICESILCSCASFFVCYLVQSVKKRSKMDTKDLIALNITIIILLCALDNFYFWSFSVSAIVLQLLIYICAYFLSRKTAAAFTLSLCLIISLLHSENLNYFLIFYIPALFTILVSKIEKRHIVLTYFIFQSTVISFTGLSFYSIPMILTPLISGFLFFLIPKNKFADLISQYISYPDDDTNSSNNELCVQYCLSAQKLINSISKYELKPILDENKIDYIKKILKKSKCKNIEVTNYYSIDGKQVIVISFESEKEISFSFIADKLYSKLKLNVKLKEDKSENSFYLWKLEACNNFKLESYALYKAKKGENICGDNACAFKGTNDNYYIIVADGMGSGKDAYTKSSDTINILKKLLKSGADPITAIKTVNSSISMLKDELGFSTIDMCEISLETGVANFYKCGAYSTLILRNKSLIKIKENGFPAGLNNEISPEKQMICLQDGDYIIMMSDGVLGSLEYIERTLLLSDKLSSEALARNLIENTNNRMSADAEDDITVVVSKFNKTKNNYAGIVENIIKKQQEVKDSV